MMPPLPMPPFMRYRMYSFVFWRQHTIDHHMMTIIVCGEYLAHVDCMEVRFNNEGVFVHALSQSLLISNWFPNSSHSPLTANLVIIIAFIDIPIATHHNTCYLFYWCVVPFPAYPVIYKWSQHLRKFFHIKTGFISNVLDSAMFGIFHAEDGNE